MKKQTFIAVVIKAGGSGRTHGDWASFVGESKDEVVQKAAEARAEWHAKHYGPYRILVGTLTEEIVTPKVQYRTAKLKGGVL